MSKDRLDSDYRPAFVDGLEGARDSEVRLYVGLDASSSMGWLDKYAQVAKQYPKVLQTLQETFPAACVETWLFNAKVFCFAPLSPVAHAKAPLTHDYWECLQAGSAITDCLVEMLDRAHQVQSERGPAPSRLIVWTDGWNRLSRYSPEEARSILEHFPEVEVHLIGLVHEAVREQFTSFVSALGLAEEAVFVFEHTDDLDDTQATLNKSAQQLLMSMTIEHEVSMLP